MTISDKLDYISNGKINKTSMKYIIEIDQEFHKKDKEIDQLEERFDKIKNYLKQVHYEQQHGILSSNNLIYDNIIRLCDGEELINSVD